MRGLSVVNQDVSARTAKPGAPTSSSTDWHTRLSPATFYRTGKSFTTIQPRPGKESKTFSALVVGRFTDFLYTAPLL